MSSTLRNVAAMGLVLVAGILGAGCGNDEPSTSGEEPTPAPAATAFPEPGAGPIDEFIAEVGETNEVVAAQSAFVFEPGESRLGFALFDVAGPQIDDADVAVYVQDDSGGKVEGPFPARTESLDVQSPYKAESAAEGDATSVYVADVPLEKGEHRAVAVIRDADGEFAATNFQEAIAVADQPKVPDVGEPAPTVHTPTLDDVADVSDIDTRIPPSTMHSEDFADVVGKKPVVLLFATPALCQSRVCGPVVDVTEQVKAEFGDKADFIHMEIFEDNQFDPKNPKLRPQVQAYGLPTEPWLFVIDKNGEVATRVEGAFSVAELEGALEPLIG